ncbi:probably inactive leucine-rich repeat receptor-like protein kinase at3g28040 [Phtheirospermum japonicum]|uniref:Probably inactive leucine-rich repeat receptor-like protein kinase at3g28040 n=1 Tax=Phtheirospermum japonicum TaxID=374723 RepID=A0A830AY03_9LAMI|nr:probably inactive leucine-rich repeat receptor-like protein kinase at3g28040 [Phtheirospermum japonicum]
MSEPEKMEALRRAYAEMILNTAKEAAARVMVAELRARKLEQDLACTKGEAARMLLCLKQMIDAKTKDAEITSLDQHKKIDVLESQLSEAEGIIIDLRAELNQAHEQLDEAKNKKPHFSRHNENHSVPGQLKEPELFRNGCTQRIFATESSVNPDPNLTVVNGVKESVLEDKVQRGKNEEVAVSIVRRSTRKRKLKYLDDVMTACGLHRSNRFKKPKAENMELIDVSIKQVKSSNSTLNDDVLGLIVFKSDIEDPHNELSTWNEDDVRPCNKLAGVKCNSNGVSELVLDGLGLSGKLCRGFLLLNFLQKLSLAENNLTRSLSLNFSQLPYLRVLDLSENGLSGSIPIDFFSQCGSLRSISLDKNEFSCTIPDSLSSCSSLTSLSLWGNQFSGSLPLGIRSMPALESLDLSDNLFGLEVEYLDLLVVNLDNCLFLTLGTTCISIIKDPYSMIKDVEAKGLITPEEVD